MTKSAIVPEVNISRFGGSHTVVMPNYFIIILTVAMNMPLTRDCSVISESAITLSLRLIITRRTSPQSHG